MKATFDTRIVETHGLNQVEAFRIKNNGKAFKVLIDGLYSDKIRAVIRELCSNALDAHVMANTADVPFEVQLPNRFEPIFRVRDYGIGMSHETIMSVYATVFESTKEDTNEQVGKFGLGSKSPFAYTDTFTVTSFTGTQRLTYSAFIGADYVPQIALMSREDCDEPRGIEVQFPVKTDDCWAFERAAETTLLGFDVMPIIKGAKLQVLDTAVTMQGNGWKLMSAGPYRTKAHARQGCVIYPIDHFAIDHITDFERAILTSAFLIDFPVGDLEISASRESLGYDEPTKANIRARIEQVALDIVDAYQSEINNEPSLWKACIRFKQVVKDIDSSIAQVLRAKMTYKGKPLKTTVDLKQRAPSLFDKSPINGGIRAMYLSRQTLDKGRNYGRRASLKFEDSRWVKVRLGETFIIVDDVDKPASHSKERIRYWWDRLSDDERNEVVWIKAKMNSFAMKRVLVALGRPDNIILLSDLDRPPADSRRYARRPTKMKVLRGSTWIEAEVDEDDDIIYVQLTRNSIIGHRGGTHVTIPSVVDETATCLKKLGYLDDSVAIVGVPQTHKSKINSNPHWTLLWDIARKAIDEKYDASEAAIAASYRSKVDEYTDLSVFFQHLVKWNDFNGFDDPTGAAAALYAKWCDVMDRAKKTVSAETALKLHTLLGGSYPAAVDISFKKEVDAFCATYPMAVRVIDYEASNPEIRKHVIQYVNGVDKLTKLAQCEATENDAIAA